MTKKNMRAYQAYFTRALTCLASLSLTLPVCLPAIASIEGAAAGLGKDKPAAQTAPPPQQVDPPPPPPERSYPAPSSKPKPNSTPVLAPEIPSAEGRKPTIKRVNFVNLEFGILAKGDLVSGDRYYHIYYFEGKKNQPVEIRLVGSRDKRLSLIPSMFLFRSNDKEPLVRRFGGENTDRNAFVYMRLPEDGVYGIVVTSLKPRATGRYSLAIRDDRATYLLDKTGDLTNQSPKIKQDNSPYEAYEFQGRRDQFVNIRVDSLRAEFSPTVYLLNSKGTVISTSSDLNYLYRVLIERTQLPADDTYYIVVNSVTPKGRGKFRVSVY